MKTNILTIMIILLSVAGSFAQEEISNQQIIDAVEDQFRFDHAVDANRLSINATNGVVELTGNVNNIKAKERATKLAEMVKGVRTISNRIQVTPSEDISDESIRTSVVNALFGDPAADSYEVSALVDDGVVTLKGTVDSYQEKQLCADVAKSVSGVVGIKNELKVNYKTDRPDAEIKYEIQEALKWDESVDDGLIDVSVNKGNVKLKGIVGSASDKTNAYMASWIAGVKSVDQSKLEVQWWADDENVRKNKSVQYTDEEIAKAIKNAAFYDPRVSGFNVEPEVNAGWVTLRGVVDNLKAKQSAEHLAENTLGVHSVTNRIKVKSDKIVTDDKIKEKVEAGLMANAVTERWQISVNVLNGIVTLTGTVDSYVEKSEAEWVASGVDGVVDVNNILTVTYPYSYYWYGTHPNYHWYHPTATYSFSAGIPDDSKIKNKVENEIWWSPYVSSDQVSVSVKNGEVTLEGEVDSWKELRKAVENAWEGGAWFIDNQLEVSKSSDSQ